MSEPTSEPSPQQPFEQSTSVPPPPAVGYPAPPKPEPALAPTGVGIVLALGGVLALVSGFLQYVKVSWSQGSYSFTGLGAETATGQADAAFFEPGNPGRTIFGVGVVAVVLGLLVIARQGRLWVGIVAVLAGAIGTLLGVVALIEPSRDADNFERQAGSQGVALEITGSIGIGAILGTVGALVALGAGIAAIVKRTRQSAPSESAAPLPTGPAPGDELAS